VIPLNILSGSPVTNRRTPVLVCLCAVAALAVAACGGTSTKPTPVTPPVVEPPPVVRNDAPVIVSMAVTSPRVEADQTVVATAYVSDAETPLDQLNYQWSATPVNGTFSGSGPIATWRAPRQQTTPDLYTLKVLITEKYTSAGQPKENTVSSIVQVHYNDSVREITTISMKFLTELFPTYTIPANQAVVDFSDSCSGKDFEFNDITNNRINFQILSGTYNNVSVSLNTDRTYADVSGACVFRDIPKDPTNPNYGKTETVTGICRLTVIYENWKWWLCTSGFEGSGITTNSLRYRVPGRIKSE
jgi:hypothetical protein